MGHPLVMGRRTHASIGRALPGRLNIVIARDPATVAPGCVVVPDLAAALHAAGAAAEVMVVGGAAVYAAALPLCRRLFVTEVHAAVDGDVFFPEFEPGRWRETGREPPRREGGYEYSFVVLERADLSPSPAESA
jgi:dihydrofolate reductase